MLFLINVGGLVRDDAVKAPLHLFTMLFNKDWYPQKHMSRTRGHRQCQVAKLDPKKMVLRQ